MRNYIDARNVSSELHNRYYASSEFLDKVTDSYLIAGALHHFGMSSVDDEPTTNLFEGSALDSDAKKKYVVKVISDFLEEHVITNTPELSMTAPISNDLKCRVCSKPYKRPKALAKHELEKHNIREETVQVQHTAAEKEDRIKNYTRQLLILLLLRADHNDAIKYGDGERVIRLYKYFCLYFKVSECPKYALAMLHLQAQVHCLLSPRLAHSLTWNRYVNHRGKPDTNHPMDLEIEHDNKSFKNDCHSYRGEITDKSMQRVGRSTETSDRVVNNFDKITQVVKPSGKHTMMSTTEDVLLLVDHLLPNEVFRMVPGRAHSCFPDMPQNILERLDCGKLKDWISQSLKKFGKKHYYRI